MSQDLFAQISSLERTARLYQVLNDHKLLELYRGQDSRLTATLVELGRQVRTDDARHTLAELTKLQRTIGKMVLSMPQPSYGLAQLLQSFADLSALREEAATPIETKAAETFSKSAPDGAPIARPTYGFLLVVDDIEANRDVLSRRLKSQGHGQKRATGAGDDRTGARATRSPSAGRSRW